MNALWFSVLAASVVGSLHCAAMCGSFMAATTGSAASGSAAWRARASYHVGRLVTYVTLGGAAGGIGKALDLTGAFAGLARVSALVAGAIMIVIGAAALLPRSELVQLGRPPNRASRWLGVVLAATLRLPVVPRGLLVGLSTTLIPCGWLYAFVATAAGTGGVSSAVVVMVAFWLGTVPALLGVSFGIERLSRRLGPKVRAMSGAFVATAGVIVIVLRVGAPAPSAAPIRAERDAATPAEAAPMAVDCPFHKN